MLEKLPFEIREAHLTGCKRGELMLTYEEIVQLNKFLETRDSDNGVPQWRFVLVPASSRGLKIPAFAAVKPVASVSAEHSHSGTKKQLPEWAVTFQRMLNKFLQSDVSRPFADRLPHVSELIHLPDSARHDLNMNISNVESIATAEDIKAAPDLPPGIAPITRHSLISQHQKDIFAASQPHLGIVSPKQVLQRLENGEYTHCLEAFNDLYNYFLCGFRHYPPASPHWMLLHNVVTLFFTNLGAFPLKDNFDAPPSVIKQTERRVERRAVERRSVQKHHRSSTGNRGKDGESRRTQSLSHTMMNPEEMPIKRKETRALHRILSALSPELHQMLYNEFKDKAVWKVSENGQVQLNEEETSAPVFRELLNWGASRVTWQVSSSKKKQVKTSENPVAVEPSPSPADEAVTQPGYKYEDWLSSSDPDRAMSSSSSEELTSVSDEEEDDEEPIPNTASMAGE